MSSKRASKAELLKRREEIQELILKGSSKSHIEEAMSNKWETSKRAISEDIRTIAKEWQEKTTEATQLMRNKYADRLEMLFNKSIEANNFKTALEIQKEIHKLNGLYKDGEIDKDDMPKFVNVHKKEKLQIVKGSDSE